MPFSCGRKASVDATRPVDEIQIALRQQISSYLRRSKQGRDKKDTPMPGRGEEEHFGMEPPSP
jgi:hypothetical protein